MDWFMFHDVLQTVAILCLLIWAAWWDHTHKERHIEKPLVNNKTKADELAVQTGTRPIGIRYYDQWYDRAPNQFDSKPPRGSVESND